MTRYIIIDDESIAHEIIEDYCNNLSHFKLEKNCYDAFQAMEFLSKNTVDLIFLDINMPKLSGFDFLKTLTNPPKIIVTTAYKEFAIESYELNVVDYLLKPFSFDRFLKAIQKIPSETSDRIVYKESENQDNNYIFLKDGNKQYRVMIDDILYIEAYGNYTKVYTNDKTIIALEKLSNYLQLLPNNVFFQIHKSYIISASKIDFMEGNKVTIGGVQLPIGQTYKKEFIQKIGL